MELACPTCPQCGEPPVMATDVQGFCGNPDCMAFCWDMTNTKEHNLANVSYADISELEQAAKQEGKPGEAH